LPAIDPGPSWLSDQPHAGRFDENSMSNADATDPGGGAFLLMVERFDRGEITLEQAESWVAENGCETIEHALQRASSATFDEAAWPFFLAAAWVVSRDPKQAVEAWTRYRLWGRRLWRAESWNPVVEIILHQLRIGSLKATAIKSGERGRSEVPAVEWNDLVWKRVGFADIVAFRDSPVPVYENLLVPAADVRRLWPPEGKAEAKAKFTVANEGDCEKQLIILMREDPTQPVVKAILRDRFPQVSARGFARAYRKAALAEGCEAWIAPGRRKSPQS
jgi:hypothetical protein